MDDEKQILQYVDWICDRPISQIRMWMSSPNPLHSEGGSINGSGPNIQSEAGQGVYRWG